MVAASSRAGTTMSTAGKSPALAAPGAPLTRGSSGFESQYLP
jgi:hypothetical protein